MNYTVQAHEQLLFSHEVLRARLDIRDFFLKYTVREVYENIGQVLSLVRMQLAMLDTSNKGVAENIDSPGHLVGQSIRDLRVMCKSFYPDADILNEGGFVEALRDTVKILYEEPEFIIKTKGFQKEIQSDLQLIVFKMIQEILILIQESYGILVSLTITYLDNEVKYKIFYNGKQVLLNTYTGDSLHLTLQERAQLIKGKLGITKGKSGLIQVQLSHTLNYTYE